MPEMNPFWADAAAEDRANAASMDIIWRCLMMSSFYAVRSDGNRGKVTEIILSGQCNIDMTFCILFRAGQ